MSGCRSQNGQIARKNSREKLPKQVAQCGKSGAFEFRPQPEPWDLGNRGSLTIKGNNLDNVLRGSELNDIIEGGGGSDDFLLYVGMGNDKVTDFNSDEGDEVLLAYGLSGYQFANTSTGAMYSLEDGSSLELVYEFIA